MAIVSRNRPPALRRTLASLRAQDRQPWEIVVADDSEPDFAARVLALAQEFDCRYLRASRHGLPANRNAAARHCRGTHVRMMDEGQAVPPRHWRHCEQAVARDPEAIWVIGECAAPWSISGGSTIYPARLFRAGIVFCEAFACGACDLEFGSRLHRLGYRIRRLCGTDVLRSGAGDGRGAPSAAEAQEAVAAHIFAALAHGLRYQPTPANRLRAVAAVLRTASRGPAGRVAVRRAYRAYRTHRREVVLPR
ncbi:MAG: glycosyltransferase family 2 protein [Solirubrobacterales bacterium]|nr:glycosyltransferase family 2 protein [Solirubrobacterales bacterium]